MSPRCPRRSDSAGGPRRDGRVEPQRDQLYLDRLVPVRFRAHSPQTTLVLAALAARVDDWRYGYDLIRETGIAAGTLYPILIRLAERGLLETSWSDERERGPRRHLYRLTATGAVEAARISGTATPATAVRLQGQSA